MYRLRIHDYPHTSVRLVRGHSGKWYTCFCPEPGEESRYTTKLEALQALWEYKKNHGRGSHPGYGVYPHEKCWSLYVEKIEE